MARNPGLGFTPVLHRSEMVQPSDHHKPLNLELQNYVRTGPVKTIEPCQNVAPQFYIYGSRNDHKPHNLELAGPTKIMSLTKNKAPKFHPSAAGSIKTTNLTIWSTKILSQGRSIKDHKSYKMELQIICGRSSQDQISLRLHAMNWISSVFFTTSRLFHSTLAIPRRVSFTLVICSLRLQNLNFQPPRSFYQIFKEEV